MSTIPLAKPFNRKAMEKLFSPYGVSVKHDGVPIKFVFDVSEQGVAAHTPVTRQDKPCHAGKVHATLFAMYIKSLRGSESEWPFGRYEMVAEATHKTFTDFKDVSGIVRSEEHAEHKNLVFNIFDFWHDQMQPKLGYASRMFALHILIKHIELAQFKPIDLSWYSDLDKAIEHAEAMAQIEVIEGAILRSGSDVYAPGKRSWGYQKVILDPTVDLVVTGFEEAVSAEGVPLGMVGRVNCSYKGRIIGVGPGKLSHDERRKLWYSFTDHPNLDNYGVAEVKYKRDDSYTALRQPTFQRFRDDKTAADVNEETE